MMAALVSTLKSCYQLLLKNGTNKMRRSLRRSFRKQKLAFGWIATGEACLTQTKLQKKERFSFVQQDFYVKKT
uniref:Putative ovule protein n=1 Tax=Solanum chacoense TaxID=4108 RepID=A0A0V0I7C2_SOLCH